MSVLVVRKCVVVLIIMFASIAAHAQQSFVEETGTLESLYESRARTVLNAFLRPAEYTIVVSADLDTDQKKLDDYQAKMDLQFVPGLPIPADPQLVPATNDLHAMKSKVKIDLILNTEVSPEKEALLKTVLTSKLHLNTEAGDAITISRVKLPDANEQIQKKPEVLPEFSWKTWALIVLLALIALAGLVFWINGRNQEKAEEKALDDELESRREQRGEEAGEEAKDDSTAFADKMGDAALEQEAADLKDQLLFLVSQYPQISAKTIGDMLDNKEEESVIAVFEYFTWDISRRLFDSISPRTWARLGNLVKAREVQPTLLDYKNAMGKVYKEILARFLEAGAEKDDTNPFGFVFRLSRSEKKELVGNEPASTFAMISLYAEGDELTSLMEIISPEVQQQVLREIARLETLPQASLLSLANSLKESLKAIKAAPSIIANGPALAAKLLRSYSPLKEIELFNQMRAEDPVSANTVRRLMAIFEDAAVYPTEIVSSTFALMDIDTITDAMYGMPAETRTEILKTIPPKRAKVVERDLENPAVTVSATDSAEARRDFCTKLEQILKVRGSSVEMMWSEMDQRGSQESGLKLVS